jgi:hypothetical protein
MKIFFPCLFVAYALTLLLTSCSKNSESAASVVIPVQENNEPLRIEKNVFWRMRENELISDTFYYQYDEQGRITSRSSYRFATELMTYTDGKISSVKEIAGSDTIEAMNYAKYSSNGDTILLDYSSPSITGTGTDTIQFTYYLKNDIVTNLLFYGRVGSGSVNTSNKYWIYNAEGNLVSQYEESPVNLAARAYEVLTWDDKINPMYGQPSLNSFFMNSGLPLESFTVHNPTMYKDDLNNIYEVEMTYNKQGYPVTVKLKNEDFISAEIFYNR